MRLLPCTIAALATAGASAGAAAAPTCVKTTAYRACADAGGAYDVTVLANGWVFSGALPQRPVSVSAAPGQDAAGSFDELAMELGGAAPATATIRLYGARPAVLFSYELHAEAANTLAFPALHPSAAHLHHVGYAGQFSKSSFAALGSDGPWLFFDDAADAFVLSPASHYLAAALTVAEGQALSSGIAAGIARLPAGFRQRTALVAGAGIGRTLATWGRFLTDLAGKTRPAADADAGLKYLGYWTDNGAKYYYRFDPALGYPGTLAAVRDELSARGVPAGYVQLDSWWYPKGAGNRWDSQDTPNRGGIYRYEAAPELFPQGLAAFHRDLGLPLVVHARWIDAHSPYRQEYAMSGNVVTDAAYWDHTMAMLADAGVVTFEQDWLSGPATPDLDLSGPDAFMDNMAAAARAHGLTLQYCMPLPRHLLQGTLYDNLLTVRTSRDRFEPGKWTEFLYTAQLASALGEWPWTDVVMSDEPINLRFSVLSGGMVGVGDALGAFDAATLAHAARADGVLVKPDESLAPLDQAYLGDAQGGTLPMIAAAATVQGPLRAAYVLAYARGDASQTATVTPAALGLTGDVYVYLPATASGAVQAATAPVALTAPKDGVAALVVPVGPSGLALLGDLSFYASLGRQRLSRWSDDGVLRATVSFAATEGAVTLSGYAPRRPVAQAESGGAETLTYDPASGLFTVRVTPGAGGTAELTLR